jgi:hypothetical protein
MKGMKAMTGGLCRVAGMLCLCLLAGAGPARAGNPGTAAPATAAALQWLARVDAGAYPESWEESAAVFRAAVGRDQWVGMIASVRRPLGRLVSRTLKSAEPTTALPGAPDGKYVVIQFDTVYENKASAVETVTPMLDADGSWRVSGYYIR